ncbi:DUF1349 domain-containing protein [Vibrio comitans]|uniref:Beta-xylosidase C-terminal Concanavalin A-like domain-containing protein n=1 Tax=Vibrio comitans NBRC 102076 TaxID=1219078 RepID=A0A4Y3IRB4_9VIBR|nr:DUF1349 domain-containing protein [Vibrio comitans]GEA62089.1 hypothetical protein VCO01S_32820 [Vibrio comitans NBRC 102076]
MLELQKWQCPNPHHSPWVIEDNILKVQVAEGNMWGFGGRARNNLFFKATDTTEYAVQASINLVPNRAFEQAGIGIYWDDDNYIKISKEMFDGRLSLVFVTESNGRPRVNALLDYSGDEVTLRLEKSQTSVAAMFSIDGGTHWQLIGTTEVLQNKERGLMLYTFSGSMLEPNTAHFSELLVESL